MIVAIGGGRPDRGETRHLDEALLRSTGQARPRLLFFPTAVRDAPEYSTGTREYFGGLGAEVAVVELTKNPSPKVVDAELAQAHVVYVGGGDTNFLFKTFSRFAMKERLTAALERGVVLAGLSAGAIVWFDGGMAAYNGYKALPGLGLAPGRVIPHYNADDPRLASWFAEHPGEEAYGLEDGTALVWDQGRASAWAAPGCSVWRRTGAGSSILEAREY